MRQVIQGMVPSIEYGGKILIVGSLRPRKAPSYGAGSLLSIDTSYPDSRGSLGGKVF